MSDKLFYDNMMSTEKIMDISAEQSVETEILLADYDTPVFKIVKTTMEHAVTQKYIMNGRLTVEGFIKLNVYYQPPQNGGMSVVSQKIPFTKQMDVQADDNNSSIVSVTGHCQYVNTRPQNPTRIDIRGAYMFSIKVFSTVHHRVVTAAKGRGVCCDATETNGFYLSSTGSRRFNIEDEITAEDNFDRVLRVENSFPPAAVSLYSDKVVLKGEISSSVYYISTDGMVRKHPHTFSYNQVVDMDGLKENHIVQYFMGISAFAIAQNSENGKLTAKLTVNAETAAFAKQQVMAVKDAFSRSFHYKTENQTVFADDNMIICDRTAPLNIAVTVPQDFTPVHMMFESSPVKSFFEIGKMSVKARITAHIIGKNAHGEYECLSAENDLNMPWFENCGRYDEFCLEISPVSATVAKDDRNIQISGVFAIHGFAVQKKSCTILADFSENTETPLENTDDALIVYYADTGEKLFDIAKQHSADPQMIREENNLTDDTLAQPQMLFIPAFSE